MTESKAFCPRCSKPANKESTSFPFCSERCKMMDLGAWATEKYKIPVAPDDEKVIEQEQE